jgi:hypothetical protein
MRVPHSVSVLWALSPELARRNIEHAHIRAASMTLLDLELNLGGYRTGQRVPGELLPRGVFACLRRRADWDQMPNLTVRAIIPNVGFLRDGTVTEFGSTQLVARRASLAEAYRALLGGQLQKHVGAFQEWAGTDMRLFGVPAELCAKCFFDPNVRSELTDASGRPARTLGSQELLGAWRRLGDKYGWGPKQAEALLAQMKWRQAWKSIKAEWGETLRRARVCTSQVRRTLSLKHLVHQPSKPPPQDQPIRSRRKDIGHSH